jgi:hypothetical protein
MQHSFIALAFAISMFGCGDRMDIEPSNADGLQIKITASDDKGNHYNETITSSDIDCYDFSSHYVYLKKEKPFLKEIVIGNFCVYIADKEIYKGLLHPVYSSTMSQGVVVYTPNILLPDYIFNIDWIYILQHADDPLPNDPRDNQEIINSLKTNDLYREGLSCEIQSVRFLSNNGVELKFKLTNNDNINYYHLDPDKMGFGLFHYFTNGPAFLNVGNPEYYCHKMEVVHPDPWDSWQKEWLSLIKGKETKIFTIEYNLFEQMPAGKYRVSFSFPGLTHVDRKDLNQIDGRIWLGESLTSIFINK